MAIPLLKDVPLAPPADLGPYRRKDYEALPDEPRCELIYGRFYVSPSPSVLHQIVVLLLAGKLQQIAQKARAWVFVAPLDVNLFEHSVAQPDILYISAARRRIIEERIEGAPDLVVEVLSPGTARRDRGEKLRLYAEAGIREYWIFDLPERQIEFLRNDAGQFVVALPEGGVYRSQALPEISLDIAEFWREIEEQLARLDEEEP
ncbi:MAG TPA: Uma2 family endonuclease [Thermoanaerobaculia bacterium]|jgi:Uma2 family endonuclease